MAGDRPKNPRLDAVQTELNRQALVENGKRLAELEKKMWDLEREAEDLKYFSMNTLETTKRLQGLVAQIVGARVMRPVQPGQPKIPALPVAKVERTKKKPER
jgi:hypothetical protein